MNQKSALIKPKQTKIKIEKAFQFNVIGCLVAPFFFFNFSGNFDNK